LACVLSPAAGTAWHSVQASGADRNVVWLRCAACAPTAFAVVTVSPRVPMGGEALAFASAVASTVLVASPWHAVQDPATCAVVGSVTAPSTCVAAFTVVCE
jgi:hypothetical protein